MYVNLQESHFPLGFISFKGRVTERGRNGDLPLAASLPKQPQKSHKGSQMEPCASAGSPTGAAGPKYSDPALLLSQITEDSNLKQSTHTGCLHCKRQHNRHNTRLIFKLIIFYGWLDQKMPLGPTVQ